VSNGGNSAEITTSFEIDSHSDYELWYKATSLPKDQVLALCEATEELAYQPQISIVTPVFRTPEGFLRKCIDSVKTQAYPHWELVLVDDGSNDVELTSLLRSLAEGDRRIQIHTLPTNVGIALATNAALEKCQGEYVAFLDHDDELSADALFRVVETLNQDPLIDVLYSDEDKIDEQGRHREGFFKPDWSPDLLRSLNYICHFLVVRRALLTAVGGLRPGFEGSQDYDLILRLSERSQKIHRVARILYHWRRHDRSTSAGIDKKPAASEAGRRALEQHLSRNGVSGTVEEISPCRYRVRYDIAGDPHLSIIIPTGGSDTLRAALQSILDTTTYRAYSVVIVDNSSGEKVRNIVSEFQTRSNRLTLLDCRDTPFNFSRLCNRGAEAVESPFLLFLNDDTSVITPDWIEAMLEHAQRKEVGAVGARLLFPNNTLQHAGVIVGLFGAAGHAFRQLPDGPQYFGLAHLIRNCSAVTGACLLVRRDVFELVDGFDEFELPTCFQDVDLCLKLAERGYHVVYTPFAQLYHHESYSKKVVFNPAEMIYLQTRWRNVIADDPYYNPNLTRSLDDYSLSDNHLVGSAKSGSPRAARSMHAHKSSLGQHRTASIGQRSDALRSNAEARIFALRAELEGARRLSEELVAELNSEKSVTARSRIEINELTQQKENLSTVLEGVLGSMSWKITGPIRRIVGSLPRAARRQLRRMLKLIWWSVTFQLLRKVRALRASGVPVAPASPEPLLLTSPPAEDARFPPDSPPSERFRLANPAWIEPQKRADFLQLCNAVPHGRIAVVLHLYYADLWPEISEALLNIVEPFDLFVTVVAGVSEDVVPNIRAAFPNANILTVDNHGRDILPFLQLVRSGMLFRYELICKLHSKRSAWVADGDEWRQHLIEGVLGSPETVEQILRAFDLDPDLGMVVADRQIFGGREVWVSNEARLLQLFRKIGLKPSSFEKGFAGGSIFWIRPFLLRSINALGLGFDDFEPEPIEIDGTTAHAVERLFSLICHDAGMRIEETGNLSSTLPAKSDNQRPLVNLIANYLPQFHPIPENNAWWGEGFTEWTNVTAAKPLFRDHRQPRLPSDLGFYDLRLPEVRQAQADLARRYGITAFSYYYYWFNGRRLLERSLDEILTSGMPDFPFMICWANEPWTRNWDGLPQEVLLPQDYQPGWERSFAADIAPFLRDRRYFRLNGRPVIAIYRVMHIPGAAEAMLRLRAALTEQGLPDVHLIGGWLQVGGDDALPPFPEDMNLDAYFEFPPHEIAKPRMSIDPAHCVPGFPGSICDYNTTVELAIDQLAAGSEGFRYRGVMTGWDNTARRGRNALVFHGATPTNFRRWLRAAVERAHAEAFDAETAVFINAWNEWGEGTYLEPDRDFGHGWLEAVASAVKGYTLPRIANNQTHSEVFRYEDFDIPVNLMLLTGAGPETFDASSREHIDTLEKFVEIKSDYSVLEIGCGIGRDAIPLTKLLSGAGKYLGVEIDRSSIEWCTNNISKKYPNFRFEYLDVKNERYNPRGAMLMSEVCIPLQSNTADLIIAQSVFTHLLRADILHYMKEFRRLLKPGGLAFATLFIVNDHILASARATNLTQWNLTFDHEIDSGCRINNPLQVNETVAYTTEALDQMIKETGLKLARPLLKGRWSGYFSKPEFGQDVAILAIDV
jgi:lipopolysaccharide biosynthesis protein/GT2 family glycosyltransferase